MGRCELCARPAGLIPAGVRRPIFAGSALTVDHASERVDDRSVRQRDRTVHLGVSANSPIAAGLAVTHVAQSLRSSARPVEYGCSLLLVDSDRKLDQRAIVHLRSAPCIDSARKYSSGGVN